MQVRDRSHIPPCPAHAARHHQHQHPERLEKSASTDTVSFGRGPQADLVDKERVKNLFLELTQIPGASFDERLVADTIKQKLADMGYEAREDGAAEKIGGNTGNLLVDIPGTIPDAPPLIFLSHMDTVDWAVGVKPQVDGDTITSDGTTALGGDDRAGNAELLEMLRILKEKNLPHPPIQIIFTVAEEAGLLGSKALDPKDVHGMLGFEPDFFHPNEILWGSEWGPDGPDPDQTPHPRTPQENFLEAFTFDSIRTAGMEPNKWDLPWASSDSASIRQMGIPALIIGAGEQDVHSTEEHISITDLAKATELMLTIVDRANAYQVDAAGNIVPRQAPAPEPPPPSSPPEPEPVPEPTPPPEQPAPEPAPLATRLSEQPAQEEWLVAR